MFINLSNHPTDQWDKQQKDAAEKMAGTIAMIPFPAVPADADEVEVSEMAEKYIKLVLDKEKESREMGEEFAVMCQGEFCLTFQIVSKLLSEGICCVASCARREKEITTNADGETIFLSRFRFVRLRRYVAAC